MLLPLLLGTLTRTNSSTIYIMADDQPALGEGNECHLPQPNFPKATKRYRCLSLNLLYVAMPVHDRS
jgi:hypothetical protein